MAWICDKNGNRKCEIKKLSYNGTFMEVSSITVTVESPTPIDFAIGDYIDWDYDGLRYSLDTAAGVEKQARRNTIGQAFVYENLVFLSPLQAANNVDFLDVVIGNTFADSTGKGPGKCAFGPTECVMIPPQRYLLTRGHGKINSLKSRR